MGEIWAIILAAGESKRMGSPKMLLPVNGTTMIENVVANVAASKTDNILVVTGAFKEPIVHLLEKAGVRYCYNAKYIEGMLSSVICGFRNLPSDFAAALVFQGDQPLITPAVINRLIDGYLSSEKGIAVPIYRNNRGHPLLIDRKYRTTIENLDPAEGLKSLLQKFQDDVLEVDTDQPGILRDFDTIEEFDNEFNQIK